MFLLTEERRGTGGFDCTFRPMMSKDFKETVVDLKWSRTRSLTRSLRKSDYGFFFKFKFFDIDYENNYQNFFDSRALALHALRGNRTPGGSSHNEWQRPRLPLPH